MVGALQALPASAALGGRADSIDADATRLAATRVPTRMAATTATASTAAGSSVATLTWADGSTIRQFVGPDGRVYAIAWNTRSKPRLDQLLGDHFAPYAQAGRLAMQQRSGVQHGFTVQQGDLVVESNAHLQAHVGRAYLRSLVPAGGAALDAVR
jgi:hypothetical protein